MPPSRLVSLLDRLRSIFRDSGKYLDQRSHGWLGMIFTAFKETLGPNAAIIAAAIAYFSLFSLFPIILVSIAIASFNISPLVTQQFIINRLEFIAPAIGQLLGQNIDKIIHSRGPVTIIALVGLIWSASNVFNMLNQTIGDLWGYKRVTPLWERRGLAILVVLIFAGPVLVIISFAGGILTSLHNSLPTFINPVNIVLSYVLDIILNIGLFTLLYIIFPHRRVHWRILLRGAIGAGILWEIAKVGFLIFISRYLSASNLIYGSVAAIIAFLTWAYLSGLIFLFGAYLSRAIYEQRTAERSNK